MKAHIRDINLSLFGLVSSGVNATVSTGSAGSVTDNATSAGVTPYPAENHAYLSPNTDLSPEMKVYYKTTLIEEAQPNLVHAQFGQKRDIPSGSGKTIEFRKYDSFGKALTPLSEGVTPTGHSFRVTAKHATPEQYGDYVGVTDVLKATAVDDTIYEVTKLNGQQMGATFDTIVRNVLQSGTNVLYCPQVVSGTSTPVLFRTDLNPNCRLTVKQVKKAAAILKGFNAPKIDGYYVAIAHPYALFDLMDDDEWKDVENYAAPENRLTGEVGRIGGVRFVETTEAAVYAPAFINGSIYNRLHVKTAIASGSESTSVVIKEELKTATGLNIPVYVDGVENKITAITAGTGSSTLTLGTAVAVDVDDLICGTGGTKTGDVVFTTLVLGDNAYGTTEIEGLGSQVIVKPLGSGDDPLNQRATIGWKGMLTAKILLDQYMLRIESSSDEIDAVTN